jgi:cysteinyl-tRNA synthetase
MKYLGDSFDIHTGGIDNMFPHHEDEIAQSEGVTGKKWVNYWLHCDHLMVDGDKMSKSLGNFYTLRDLIARGYTGREIRWVLIGTHYRKKLNFTFGAVDQARELLNKVDELVVRLQKAAGTGDADIAGFIAGCKQSFENGIFDDLNISGAVAALYELMKGANRRLDQNLLSAEDAQKVLDCLKDFDRVFGCFDVEGAAARCAVSETFPAEVQALAEQRAAARKAKDFAESDRLRDAIKAMGYVVEDVPGGAWKLKKI